MTDDALSLAARLAHTVGGFALAAGLLSSVERWSRHAAEVGSDLSRIHVVNVLSAFIALVMELEEGALRGGAPLLELGGPARGLLDGLIGWDGEGSPPDAVIACAQSSIPMLGFAPDHTDSFRAAELPTFPGVDPTEDDLARLGDDQLVDDVSELRLLLQRLADEAGCRYVALFDRSAALVHTTLQPASVGREASETLMKLARAPGLTQTLRHVDLFTTVRRGDEPPTVLRLTGAHATLVAQLREEGSAERLRVPELHFLLDALIEARSARLSQLSLATLVPGQEEDPFF